MGHGGLGDSLGSAPGPPLRIRVPAASGSSRGLSGVCGAVGAAGRVPRVQEWLGGSFPTPSLPTSVLPHLRPSPPPSLPDAFPLAATRAVTHAVKIFPSPPTYKQKMRLDSAPCEGSGLQHPHPRQGLRAGGAGGSQSTHTQGGTPRAHPGFFREAKITVVRPRERGGGWGCSSGASSPGVTLGLEKPHSQLTHTHGNPPSTGVTPSSRN